MNDKPPSILAITSEPPWPLNSGGHIRTYYLLKALARRFHVRLVTAVTPEEESAINALESLGVMMCPAHVSSRGGWREPVKALKSMLIARPYVLYERHNRGAVRRTIKEQIAGQPPDLLYLDHLDSMVYRDVQPEGKVVLDCHNVYSRLTDRAADERRGFAVRRYLKREARLLADMEAQAARDVDMIFAVSETEAEFFSSLGGKCVRIVPNGVDCARYAELPEGREAGPPIILYIGAMSWEPNARAAIFLAREVMPKVQARLPDARLQVVGRDPPPELQALTERPGVEVTGSVSDILMYLRNARVLAVPLEAGGGTRLKILEAFAAGLPVVSTPIGCEGIAANDGEHLLIRTRAEFANGLVELLTTPDFGCKLAAQARLLAQQTYDWEMIGANASEHLRELCAGNAISTTS